MEPKNLMPHQTQPAKLSAIAELSEEALTEISAGGLHTHDEFLDKVDGPLVTDGTESPEDRQKRILQDQHDMIHGLGAYEINKGFDS